MAPQGEQELVASFRGTKRTGYEAVTILWDEAEEEHDEHQHSHEEEGDEADNYDRDEVVENIDDIPTVSIDQAIELVGYGLFQYRILIATGLCFAADAMQVVCLTFLTPILQKEWGLTTKAAASLASTFFAGAVVGTLFFGPLADRIGRRPVFVLAASTISAAGFCAALAHSYATMMLAMFAIGFGVGGMTVPFDILAEFLPSDGRGTKLVCIEYFWTIGCLYVVAVVYFFLDQWRVFQALCTLPCMLSLIVGIIYVPESPRWLAEQDGRLEEAAASLRAAAKVNGRHDVYFRLERPSVVTEHHNASVMELFQPRWRMIVLRLWATWAVSSVGYVGTLMTITRVFKSQGSVDVFDFSAIFISNGAEVVGVTLVILLMDRIGRIPSQVISYALSGLFAVGLCFGAKWSVPRTALIAMGFGARAFCMAASCATWVSTAEILTTEVRSTGHSIANALAKIGSTLTPYVVGLMALNQVGLVLLSVQMVAAICVSQLPETGGREMGAAAPAGADVEEEEAEALVAADDDDDEVIVTTENAQQLV